MHVTDTEQLSYNVAGGQAHAHLLGNCTPCHCAPTPSPLNLCLTHQVVRDPSNQTAQGAPPAARCCQLTRPRRKSPPSEARRPPAAPWQPPAAVCARLRLLNRTLQHHIAPLGWQGITSGRGSRTCPLQPPGCTLGNYTWSIWRPGGPPAEAGNGETAWRVPTPPMRTAYSCSHSI